MNNSNNKDKKEDIQEVLNEENKEVRDKKYNEYVKKVTPTHNVCVNVLRAFIVGGGIHSDK